MSAIVEFIIPPHCLKKFVEEHDFDGECIKTVISKLLGFAIILGSVFVKVPQILKIIKSGSAEGISLLGVVLELIACTGTLAYSFAKGFPFSSYGESTFMTLQQVIIMFLVLNFCFGVTKALIYISVYSAMLAFLLSPSAPMGLLTTLQASVVILVVVSRFTQAATNFMNQSTGQLSLVTIVLQCVGAFIRILTSLQETGDFMTITMYVVSTITNGILLFQVFRYWDSSSFYSLVSNHAGYARSSQGHVHVKKIN